MLILILICIMINCALIYKLMMYYLRLNPVVHLCWMAMIICVLCGAAIIELSFFFFVHLFNSDLCVIFLSFF